MIVERGDDGRGARAAATAAAAPLPCRGSNNSIGELDNPVVDAAPNGPAIRVSKGAYKTEHCLKENIRLAVERHGIGHFAFFTPTFARPVYSPEAAQQRLNSLLTNVIRPRYGDRYIAVFERHDCVGVRDLRRVDCLVARNMFELPGKTKFILKHVAFVDNLNVDRADDSGSIGKLAESTS